jgi:hypothetical protein
VGSSSRSARFHTDRRILCSFGTRLGDVEVATITSEAGRKAGLPAPNSKRRYFDSGLLRARSRLGFLVS